MENNELVLEIDEAQRTKDTFRKNVYELDERFVIKDGKKHKCAIICPGGAYYMVCSFVEGVPLAKKLNEEGISAVIVYYRVRRKALYPNPQDDLARAVKEISERADELNLDMDGYSVWGSSAGGHLVASFGTPNMGYSKYGLNKPGALILLYPVISMDKSLTHIDTHNNLLGKDADLEKEEFASVEKHVDETYPPTFVWCGDADGLVNPDNTRVMVKALEIAGVSYEFRIYPGVDHGVGTGKNTVAYGWMDEAISFWKRCI